MTSLSIIGSTGSIGKSALEVVENRLPDVKIVALGAGRNAETLSEQALKHNPEAVSVADEETADRLRQILGDFAPRIIVGVDGMRQLAGMENADTVLVCVAGALGVWPAWEAVRSKKRLALATKEALVLLGPLLADEARRSGAEIIPVDSEHSALFQLMRGLGPGEVRRLWLGASGGPFREADVESMRGVTPSQALNHPVWEMGPKVTVDSSTLMNKGLEIIEARWLFETEPDKIKVIIHPQGLVHAMVELVDGTVLMHAGTPDMKAPIAYALSYPERTEKILEPLNLASAGSLTFEEPDLERFPCLSLAWKALEMGDSAPAALNAADEVAVKAFLEGEIPFMAIPEVIEKVLNEHQTFAVNSPEDALAADEVARKAASKTIENMPFD